MCADVTGGSGVGPKWHTHTHSHVLTVHRTMAPVRAHLILFTAACPSSLSGQFKAASNWPKVASFTARGPPITDALTLGHFGKARTTLWRAFLKFSLWSLVRPAILCPGRWPPDGQMAEPTFPQGLRVGRDLKAAQAHQVGWWWGLVARSGCLVRRVPWFPTAPPPLINATFSQPQALHCIRTKQPSLGGGETLQ